MVQATSLKLTGVATHKNRLSEVKEGALARAQNLINDRESLIEPRRGMAAFGGVVEGASDTMWRVFPYGGKLITHVDSSLYLGSTTGEWTLYPEVDGDIEGPVIDSSLSLDGRCRDAAANDSVYLTTSTGVIKLDHTAGAWVAAGTPKPLDGSASTTGASGFLTTGYDVGYRAFLFYTDYNDREVVSAASGTAVGSNSSGGDRNMTVTFYIPTGLTTSYYYRVYRSEAILTGSPPSDELQQVYEAQLASADISAGYVSFTDTTPDSLRGAKAYTNPSEDGIAENNDQPPLAVDMCFYRGHMLYANVLGRHRFQLALLGTGSSSLQYYTSNGGTTNGNKIITGITSTSTLRAGMQVSGTGITSGTLIVSIDSGTQVTTDTNSTATGTVSLEFRDRLKVGSRSYFGCSSASYSNQRFKIYTSGTASQNIENTAREIIHVINVDSSASVYAEYTSGFDDTPGFISIYERNIGGSEFELATTRPEAFSPTLPTSQNGSQVSLADRRPSFVVPSKSELPEATPLAHGFRCGTTPIKRILALRDGVIVLSDTVGLITGNDVESFRYEQLDTTTKLLGPETAVVLNDAVYCMSSQGAVRITPNGVQIASRDIESDLIRLSSLSNFETQAFGIAYESDRAYHLYVPTSASDNYATMYWRYGAFTESWTHGDLASGCGVVNPADDKLYLAKGGAGYFLKERKAHDYTDYADETVSVTISGAGSAQTQITVNSTTGISADDLLVQSTREIRVLTVDDATHLTLETSATWSNGSATIYKPITCVLETLPFSAGNAGLLKHFTEATFLFRDAQFADFVCSVASNFFPDMGTYQLTLQTTDYSSTWSVQPTGSDVKDEQGVRTYIPGDVSRALWLRVRLTFSICRESMALAGISAKFRELSSRFMGSYRS